MELYAVFAQIPYFPGDIAKYAHDGILTGFGPRDFDLAQMPVSFLAGRKIGEPPPAETSPSGSPSGARRRPHGRIGQILYRYPASGARC